MVYDRVGDLSQIARHALCEASKPVIPLSPLECPQTHACRGCTPGSPPGPSQPIAVRLPRWWGLPLAFTCLRPCQCDAISPSSPPALPMSSYPPLLRKPGEPCFPSLRPRRYPYLPYPLLSSFPPRPPSLLSAQDDEEGVYELTQVIVLHRPESSSVISSPPCLRSTKWRLLPSQGHRNKHYTNNDAIHDESRRPRAVNANLPAM